MYLKNMFELQIEEEEYHDLHTFCLVCNVRDFYENQGG